jgi:hypothetical protein
VDRRWLGVPLGLPQRFEPERRADHIGFGVAAFSRGERP